jgi:hypothetical protein
MQKNTYFNLFALSVLSIIVMAGIMPGRSVAAAAEKPESLASRLQRLEDREEIRQLLKDYGRFLDQRDFASFSRLFAEKDGEWIGGMGKAKGPQAIQKLMEDSIGKNTEKTSAPNFHLFTNEIININGNQADATTKWIFVVQGDTNRPQALLLGHYEDSMIRENGRWKFLRRVVHADIPPDNAIPKK